MTIKMVQFRNGRVRLEMDREDLSSLLLDAARQMGREGGCQPLKEEVLVLAKEFVKFEELWNPDSGSVYLLKDVKGALNEGKD